MKKLNSLKPILFWNLFLAIILVLSACGDFVKESDTGSCNNAINSRDYETALKVCTSRKDKATAYMGKAGYDIVNLLDASSKITKKYVEDSNLGEDDNSGLAILNILHLSADDKPDDTKRATAIEDSKKYLDKATELLHPYLSDDSSPLSTDEILLDSFALAFAMQLNQLIIYDNATTSTSTFPDNDSDGSLVCDNATTSKAHELRAMDGHLWQAERDGIQCARMKSAIEASDNQTAVLIELDDWETGTKLPEAIYEPVCDQILSLAEYHRKLTNSIDNLTLSGDNTKAITDAKTSTDNLTKTVGCVP